MLMSASTYLRTVNGGVARAGLRVVQRGFVEYVARSVLHIQEGRETCKRQKNKFLNRDRIDDARAEMDRKLNSSLGSV